MNTPMNSKSGHPKLKKLRQRLQMKAKDAGNGEGLDDQQAQVVQVGRKNELFNRSSPMKLVRLCKEFNRKQRHKITISGFGSFLDTKISKLHPDLCKFLMESFNPDTCELQFGGRGSIPINEQAVHRVLKIPIGNHSVKYCIDTEATNSVFDMLEIKDGKHPKLSDLEKKLASMGSAGDLFMRMWMLYAMSSVIAPTTGIIVSPRCYPSILDVDGISDLNWCRFVVDVLVKTAKAKEKNMFKACMPFLMILYIDSLDIKSAELKKKGPRICVWSNKLVRMAVNLDKSSDGSFGMLPLKKQCRSECSLFCNTPSKVDSFIKFHAGDNFGEEDISKYRPAVIEMCKDFELGLGKFIQKVVSGKEHGESSNQQQAARSEKRKREDLSDGTDIYVETNKLEETKQQHKIPECVDCSDFEEDKLRRKRRKRRFVVYDVARTVGDEIGRGSEKKREQVVQDVVMDIVNKATKPEVKVTKRMAKKSDEATRHKQSTVPEAEHEIAAFPAGGTDAVSDVQIASTRVECMDDGSKKSLGQMSVHDIEETHHQDDIGQGHESNGCDLEYIDKDANSYLKMSKQHDADSNDQADFNCQNIPTTNLELLAKVSEPFLAAARKSQDSFMCQPLQDLQIYATDSMSSSEISRKDEANIVATDNRSHVVSPSSHKIYEKSTPMNVTSQEKEGKIGRCSLTEEWFSAGSSN